MEIGLKRSKNGCKEDQTEFNLPSCQYILYQQGIYLTQININSGLIEELNANETIRNTCKTVLKLGKSCLV